MKDTDLRPCPWCKGDHASIIAIEDGYQVHCLTCGAAGPYSEDRERAGQLWIDFYEWNIVRPQRMHHFVVLESAA